MSKLKKKAKKSSDKKNKLGVKNSLVNNINARKKKGKSRSKKKGTVSKDSYKNMEKGWGKKKKDKKKKAKAKAKKASGKKSGPKKGGRKKKK